MRCTMQTVPHESGTVVPFPFFSRPVVVAGAKKATTEAKADRGRRILPTFAPPPFFLGHCLKTGQGLERERTRRGLLEVAGTTFRVGFPLELWRRTLKEVFFFFFFRWDRQRGLAPTQSSIPPLFFSRWVGPPYPAFGAMKTVCLSPPAAAAAAAAAAKTLLLFLAPPSRVVKRFRVPTSFLFSFHRPARSSLYSPTN